MFDNKKEGFQETKNNKRIFRQILHGLFEDEVYAFAMAYAASKRDYSTIRFLENKLH